MPPPTTPFHSLDRLHLETAKMFVRYAETRNAPYQLLLAARHAGKTTFLEHVERVLMVDYPGEWLVVRCDCKNLNKAKVEELLAIDKELRVAILIDDLEDDFFPETEVALMELTARNDSDPENRICIIATTSVPIDILRKENRRASASTVLLNSRALDKFRRGSLQLSWLAYKHSLEQFFVQLALFDKGLGIPKANNLVEAIMCFTGPFPPFIRIFAESIMSRRIGWSLITELDSDPAMARQLALECVIGDGNQSGINAVQWVLETFAQSNNLLYRVADQGYAALAAEDKARLSGYLATASLQWPMWEVPKQLRNEQLPPLVDVAIAEFIASIVEVPDPAAAPGPTPHAAASASGAARATLSNGTVRLINALGEETTLIALSEREWSVISHMVEGEIIGVDAIAGAIGVGVPHTRAALHRLIDKLAAAGGAWVIKNFKRHGYVLHLKMPIEPPAGE